MSIETNNRLESNLAFLDAALAERLCAVPPNESLKIVFSAAGLPVPVSRGTSLHSRHDPEGEANRAYADITGPPADAALVFGFGMGYHIRILARSFDRLIVYEPDPAVLRAAMEYFDWRGILPRLTVLTGDDIVADLPTHLPFIVHRPTARLYPAECDRWRKIAAAQPGAGPAEKWKILVVTPIGGGSLPIARHTIRAFERMGHEVHVADTSRWDSDHRRYMAADRPQSRRDELLRRLFASAGDQAALLAEECKPDLVLAMAQAPLDKKALARIRRTGALTAFWFVEDFRRFGYFRELAPEYDFFFHIQGRDMENELRRLGLRRFARLPLAADPDLFRPIRDDDLLAPYRAGLSFMGAGYPNRRELFKKLTGYDFRIWGNGWSPEGALGKCVQDESRRVSTEETVLIYNAAVINLNLHSSLLTNGLDLECEFVNPRTFEIAACGAFQLADAQHPLADFFTPGQEIAVFRNSDELREKIDYYLARPDLREEMGRKSRERVLARHTYRLRLAELLNFLGR